MTGDEEYEIDTFEGLSAETRAFLVEHKLTTLNDLARFQQKWQEAEITDDQKTLLAEKVTAFEAEMAERGGEVDLTKPKRPARRQTE